MSLIPKIKKRELRKEPKSYIRATLVCRLANKFEKVFVLLKKKKVRKSLD